MRRFKSTGQAQRFLSVHATVYNLFNLGSPMIGWEDSLAYKKKDQEEYPLADLLTLNAFATTGSVEMARYAGCFYLYHILNEGGLFYDDEKSAFTDLDEASYSKLVLCAVEFRELEPKSDEKTAVYPKV